MKTTILIAVLLLTGCDMAPATDYDQCSRNTVFMACLAALPTGPATVGESGDWEGVVSECAAAARDQSIRDLRVIPRGCR